MLVTVVITTAIAVLAMLPGAMLLRGAASNPGQWAAAATISLVAMMLATALLGELAGLASTSLPSVTIVPVSLIAIVVSRFATKGRAIVKPTIELPGLLLAAAFVGYGVVSQALSVREDPSGALLIHAWYNADWFKHLGHVAALADYGIPARDAFNHGAPLYYYWLSYILPGAGAALGGNNWAALNTANIIITILFCFTFYGAVRTSGAGPWPSFVSALLCLFICAPLSVANHLLTDPGGITAILNGPAAPNGPALVALSQYIPQHELTLALLLGWIVLNQPGAKTPPGLRLLTLAALASAMTLSTLLGAMALATYGFISLLDRRKAAIPELAAMAIVSGLLVLALGVIQIGNPTSAIDSPLLDNPLDSQPALFRAVNSAMLVVGHDGLPLLVAVLLLRLWKPADDRAVYAKRVAVVLILTAIAAGLLVELLMTRRLGIEMRIRAVNLPAIGIAVIGGWALAAFWPRGGRARLLTLLLSAFLIVAAAPSAYIRTVWHFNLGDRFTTKVPKDDREVLAWLRSNSAPRAVVWQYPEPPVLANPSGGDAWATVLGGRTVAGSLRATDYVSAVPSLDMAKRYFAGEPVPVPALADWIYLSRKLHPDTYDALLTRLDAQGSGWTKRACQPDACLFSRADRASKT